MAAKTVDVQEAQSHLKDLLSPVGAGTEVILIEGDTPVARLVPPESSSVTRVAGLHQGAMCPGEDFDGRLPDAFWTGNQ